MNASLPNPKTDSNGHRIAVRSAVVAGLFCLIVIGGLIADYFRRGAHDPLDAPQRVVLQAELIEHPQDVALKEKIRSLDLQLRQEYFSHLIFTKIGTGLLLVGAIVFLISIKRAQTLRPMVPNPQTETTSSNRDILARRRATWSVGLMAALLVVAVGIGIVLVDRTSPNTSGWTQLAQTLREKSTALADDSATSKESGSTVDKTTTPDKKDLPTPEEFARAWTRFRGPGGSGHAHESNEKNLPTKWNVDSGEGILWSTEVPLPGNNSPIVWGDRVFLTGADESQREVYCFAAVDGKLLWQTELPGTPQSTVEVPNTIADTGLAAPTAATDGRHVYAMFGNGDIGALDFDGKLVWSRSLGIPENAYGHSTSLLVDGDRLLVQFDQGEPKQKKSKLLALSTATGKTLWSVPREVYNSWATPILIEHQGRRQLITSADPFVIAYDPTDGHELWRAECLSGDHGISPVFADSLVYVGNEYCDFQAIRVDGEGDVTETHIEWIADFALPEMVASPVVVGDLLFFVSTYGVLSAFDLKTGEQIWEEELEGEFSSSPAVADGRVYLFSKEDGRGTILTVSREGYETVSETNLGESIVTSPAFGDGRIYIRGERQLFCLGEKTK